MDQHKNVEKSFNANSQSASQTRNGWMSYPYNNRSSSSSSQGSSISSFSSRTSSNQTSPWKRSPTWDSLSSASSSLSTTSESSWSSNDMYAMSRWPSSASFNSVSSMKSTKTCWSDTTSMRSSSIPFAPNSSRSNSFDEQNKRQFYASHSVFVDNLRSDSSDDSLNSEFDKFYKSKK